MNKQESYLKKRTETIGTFRIRAYMRTVLKLKSIDLMIYAIINDYTIYVNGYGNTISYLCELTGTSRSTVIRSLSYLVGNKYIDKIEDIVNGEKYVIYKTISK